MVHKRLQILFGNFLVFVFILGQFATAKATTFAWEHITGYMQSGQYAWTYSYDIGFYDDTLKIDVDIFLKGYNTPDVLTKRWEDGIERFWSTTRFFIPISFNVDWVTSDYDFAVNVVNDRGRWDMLHWYTLDAGGWGDQYQEKVAAHEYGHMISMWDEYDGGAVNPAPGSNSGIGGLMQTLYGFTLDYYYDPFLDWYDGKIAAAAPVPEPTSIVLFSIGIACLAGTRIRRK